MGIDAVIPNPEDHFRGLVRPRDPLKTRLEQEAVNEQIPIVGPLVGELLFVLARGMRARRILELGTATGYSAIFLAEAAGSEAEVVTIERDPTLAARASAHFTDASVGDRIRLIIGDAQALVGTLEGEYDLIFLDVDKEGYEPLLDHCARLLRIDGLLVADNTGFEAAANFNRALRDDPRWRVVNVFCFLPDHAPEWDGLCLALKCR